MIKLDILHQDNDILIINKPHNLLCVPGLSHPDNLLDIARKRFPNIRTVHRLDMATSGIIIFALDHAAQKNVSKQFELREVSKQYLAVVNGRVAANCGEVALPLVCDWPNRPRQKVDWHSGKTAHTYFEVDHRHSATTRLRLYPITGRSHQLRVHCQSIGHPIIGDRLYACEDEDKGARLMLHAEQIQFRHPATGQVMTIRSPAPFS